MAGTDWQEFGILSASSHDFMQPSVKEEDFSKEGGGTLATEKWHWARVGSLIDQWNEVAAFQDMRPVGGHHALPCDDHLDLWQAEISPRYCAVMHDALSTSFSISQRQTPKLSLLEPVYKGF